MWTHLAEYFPAKLIKTCDLPADRNYLFGVHPHGILCFSTLINCCTQGTRFSQLFPGLEPYTLSADRHFSIPFHRDVFMAIGGVSAKKESMEFLLKQPGTGKALCLVIGANEDLVASIPHRMDLTVKCRKGFVKMALRYGYTFSGCL